MGGLEIPHATRTAHLIAKEKRGWSGAALREEKDPGQSTVAYKLQASRLFVRYM